ncbi:MAG TPA: glucosamine-1-phosphate N-acetyltransferase [Chloroflexi bacterium]|nr:glucosamine-1-phosphate N-acetyltransferase [Chloroflexota bacterium]
MTYATLEEQARSQPLKVVILAAGQERIEGGEEAILLERLGDLRVIDHVIHNALQIVQPQDLYIVIPGEESPVRAYLDYPGVTYVVQDEPKGTGHAVLQLEPHLSTYEGDLLILYGDTPLFRPSTIRGLLNRHRLKGAHLTLLTAVVDQPLPYGRIIRDANGRIIDIIEETEASPEVREIQELNIGAYVVKAQTIFEVLKTLAPSTVDGEYRLTDCAHRMIRSRMRVEGYQIYDQDEVLGINSREDLDRAAFVLQKRMFRPHRHEELNIITFGTGGWRAVIGEGFTLHNVRRLSQALANAIIRRNAEAQGVLIGYDRRFLSDKAAQTAAEVFAGNNIPVLLLEEGVPTPLVTFATAQQHAAYGLVFTASHNPPEWNGLKVFRSDGSLLQDNEVQQIQEEANQLTTQEVVKIDLDLALEAGVVRPSDFTNAYVDAVENLIDMAAIREAGLRVIVDPMFGVSQLTLGIILTEARCRVAFINERHNPLFGGRSPAPDIDALRLLMTYVREGQYDLGLATDGDADRIAIVDEKGNYVEVNDILLLVYWYLHEVRGQRGGVVRNLATTHLLDRLAARFGEQAYEVPVGFKHVSAAMVEHDALLGGESSGGLTIRGHILGKDGIFAAALIVEMLAVTGKRVSQLLSQIYEMTGYMKMVEVNLPATSEMRIVIPKQVEALIEGHQTKPLRLGPYTVQRVSQMDGVKFYLEDDAWVLLRFSGTEPILRIFAEAESEDKAQALIDALLELLGLDREF